MALRYKSKAKPKANTKTLVLAEEATCCDALRHVCMEPKVTESVRRSRHDEVGIGKIVTSQLCLSLIYIRVIREKSQSTKQANTQIAKFLINSKYIPHSSLISWFGADRR